mmetsp:Transcript_11620/g.41809  ORF Transcript_11620/g.41809 Transcript_11620/m.41809 type:complete len:217 (+) Transcript_11620:1534-2184(+)|eukprot:30954-Pelagococcus_subviridis.AAC.6
MNPASALSATHTCISASVTISMPNARVSASVAPAVSRAVSATSNARANAGDERRKTSEKAKPMKPAATATCRSTAGVDAGSIAALTSARIALTALNAASGASRTFVVVVVVVPSASEPAPPSDATTNACTSRATQWTITRHAKKTRRSTCDQNGFRMSWFFVIAIAAMEFSPSSSMLPAGGARAPFARRFDSDDFFSCVAFAIRARHRSSSVSGRM